jgi:DNA-binding response OmpR family regulator
MRSHDHPPCRCDRLRRVLLVEDDQDCRELLGQILAHPRVAIAFASDGVEALRIAAEIEPEVILLDMRLPLLDGFEVLARLGHDGGPASRVILMSGGMGQATREHGAELGAYAFLKKPFDLAELQRVFYEALGLLAGEPRAAATVLPPARDALRRLLIVDDEPDVAATLSQFLAHPLVSIETATDGTAGLEKAWASKAHALLLDVGMPGVNGFEVFAELRRARFGPRILLMSGTTKPGIFTLAMQLGAYACFRKPFEDDLSFRRSVWSALGVESPAATPAESPREVAATASGAVARAAAEAARWAAPP